MLQINITDKYYQSLPSPTIPVQIPNFKKIFHFISYISHLQCFPSHNIKNRLNQRTSNKWRTAPSMSRPIILAPLIILIIRAPMIFSFTALYISHISLCPTHKRKQKLKTYKWFLQHRTTGFRHGIVMTLLITLSPMHGFRTNAFLLIGTIFLLVFAGGLGGWVHAVHLVGFVAGFAAPDRVVAVVFAVVVLCV